VPSRLCNDLLILFRCCIQAPTEADLYERESVLLSYLDANELQNLKEYYLREWASCKTYWSEAYHSSGDTGWKVMRTNNLVERFFRVNKVAFNRF
jgi:hypothetical protein